MRRGRITVLAAAAACLLTPLVTASRAAQAASTAQPLGDGTGWTLLQDQGGQTIDGQWNIDPLKGQDCTDPNNKGSVSIDPTNNDLQLTTNGTAGNCAEATSPWTVSPGSYGDVFIEYRADVPDNSFAALWSVGDDSKPGEWPGTGEIDTAEMLSRSQLCHSFHYEKSTGGTGTLGGVNDPVACIGPSPTFETYGVEWTPHSLTFFLNGVKWETINSSVITTDPEQVRLDNTTDSSWLVPGQPPPSSTMEVQYVRAWFKNTANVGNSGTPSTCLDANSNNYPNNGDAIQLWSCNTNPEQEWQVTSAGQLENAQTGMCLDANSNNYPNSGDNIQLWSCNTNPEQQWHFTSAGQLENAQTGMCLDADSHDYPNNGDVIQLWSCATTPEQKWWFG